MAHSAWRDDSLIIKVCSLRTNHTRALEHNNTAEDLCKAGNLHILMHTTRHHVAPFFFFFLFQTGKYAFTHMLQMCTNLSPQKHFSSLFLRSLTSAAPFSGLLPCRFYPVCPRERDCTWNEIQWRQHMSVATNWCHHAAFLRSPGLKGNRTRLRHVGKQFPLQFVFLCSLGCHCRNLQYLYAVC